jgi:predicted double-glycine peptidase
MSRKYKIRSIFMGVLLTALLFGFDGGAAVVYQIPKAPPLNAISHLIRVPLSRQGHDYTCGVAALQSVLYYYGKEVREDDLAEAVGSDPDLGTDYRKMVEYALAEGFDADIRKEMTLEDLERLIRSKKPAILVIQAWHGTGDVDNLTDWEDGHYVVAIGYDSKNIYLMDPSTLGNYTFIPVHEFLDRWHDQDPSTGEPLIHFGMVIEKGEPQYNLREIKYLANQYTIGSSVQPPGH